MFSCNLGNAVRGFDLLYLKDVRGCPALTANHGTVKDLRGLPGIHLSHAGDRTGAW